MDRTEGAAVATETLTSRGSQSRLSAAIFLIVLAALLFRVVTVVTNRESSEHARTSSPAAPRLVKWTALEGASAAATSTGKPILYDFAAAWCGPCHELDREGWGDRSLANLANDAFVPTRVIDREREDGMNPPLVAELQRKFAVQAFPTLVVATTDGREIGRSEGWGGREGLRSFLEDAKAKARSGAPAPAP